MTQNNWRTIKHFRNCATGDQCLFPVGKSCLLSFSIEINVRCVCVCIAMCAWPLIAIAKHSQRAQSHIMSTDKCFTFCPPNICSAPRVHWVQPHCSFLVVTLSQCEILFWRFVVLKWLLIVQCGGKQIKNRHNQQKINKWINTFFTEVFHCFVTMWPVSSH